MNLQAEIATSAVPELDYDALASELDQKSPLEIMDHVRVKILPTAFYSLRDDWMSYIVSNSAEKEWLVLLQALQTFGADIGIAFSGAEDVALIEYAHLTGRPFRVFR